MDAGLNVIIFIIFSSFKLHVDCAIIIIETILGFAEDLRKLRL